jgi:uncharacterized protein (TIGR02001 family)
MMKKLISLVVLSNSFLTAYAHADISSTVSLVSDYSFNGVSQTDESPAIQISLDYADQSGFYAGSWASNVDFGEGTDIEVDFYAGYAGEVAGFSYDTAILYYTYHGANASDELNYPEIKLSLSKGNSTLGFWYSWDYAGTDAGHLVSAFSHNIALPQDWSLTLGIDRSASLDGDKFTWEGPDKDYIHYYASASYSFSGFDVFITLEDTDLDTFGDTRVLAGISKTFSF